MGRIESTLKTKVNNLVLDLVIYLKNVYKNSTGLEREVYKNLFRDITGIGSSIAGADIAMNNAEFRIYLDKTLKNASESKYWLDILRKGFSYEIDNKYFQNLESIMDEITTVVKGVDYE